MTRPADLKFTPDLVEAMMGELKDCLDDFTDWELEFYKSIRERIDDGFELTTAQFDKLKSIYEDYCE